jgi:hypothetical protein
MFFIFLKFNLIFVFKVVKNNNPTHVPFLYKVKNYKFLLLKKLLEVFIWKASRGEISHDR